MPFSKFDPHRPVEPSSGMEASSEEAARRAMVLRWGSWITLLMVASGFGLMVYWTLRP